MDPELIAAVRQFRPAFRVLISDLAPKTTGNRWADAQQSLIWYGRPWRLPKIAA